MNGTVAFVCVSTNEINQALLRGFLGFNSSILHSDFSQKRLLIVSRL